MDFFLLLWIISYNSQNSIKTQTLLWASQVSLVVKNPPANAGDITDTGSIPGLGRSPVKEHDNPL